LEASIKHYDYIIVGSGIAGLYSALLARHHGSVLLVTKGSIEDCNTRHAQGGIAAAIGENDSAELHYQDTISAGAGLCYEEAVRILTKEAPDRIADLVNLGVPFDTAGGVVALTREAAHSLPRILHAGGDATGARIETTLSQQVLQAHIPLLEHCLAVKIILEDDRVAGLRTFDCRTVTFQEFSCRFLILATGGAGQLFRFTTNPDVATADGIALAYQAGVEIADMEFFQFHPTALHLLGVSPFLISEAVRGEGGILRNSDGIAFMSGYTPQAELAPRDVVARSIATEMAKTNAEHVFLDVTHLPAHITMARFPQIYRFCLEHGLDITHDMIPVAPAAHYMIGGIRVDTWGQSSLPGLYAAGEVACTGVHGANRLASNSLLEVLVFSKRIIERTVSLEGAEKVLHWDKDLRCDLKSFVPVPDVPMPSRSALQQLLWEKAGMVRAGSGLAQAAAVLANWQDSLPQPSDRPSWELSNLVLAGRLMVESALVRQESRGAHFRLDFPQVLTGWRKHIIQVRNG
jgi:L-aspartate oxidase